MKIQKSAEDYLETMLMLKKSTGYVRSVDVAMSLGVTRPSVSYAVKRLRENGYIEMSPDGHLELTETGLEIADRMFTRHTLLTDFFVSLGISPGVAREDACKIEHDISDETFEAIRRYIADKK